MVKSTYPDVLWLVQRELGKLSHRGAECGTEQEGLPGLRQEIHDVFHCGPESHIQ